jgi:hypothetical protein
MSAAKRRPPWRPVPKAMIPRDAVRGIIPRPAARRAVSRDDGDKSCQSASDRAAPGYPRTEPQVNDDEAFRRLIERHGSTSDNCESCGRALRSLETTLIGIDRRGRVLTVATACCSRQLAAALGFGVYVRWGEDPDRAVAAAREVTLAMGEPGGRA